MKSQLVVRCILTSIVLLMTVIADNHAMGDIVIDASEISGDVQFVGSGTIDLANAGLPSDLTRPGRVKASEYFLIGPGVNANFDIYDVVLSGPTQIGLGTTEFNATTGSGDVFGLDFAFGNLAVPDNYVSGTQLSGITTFSSQTFQSMGLTAGTYSWSDGTNNIQLNVASVPEPGCMLGITLLGMALGSRRRRDS